MQNLKPNFLDINGIFKKKDLKKKISSYLHICQCGKQFLSFPAIYSHSKTKHNFKISSRIGDQGKKVVEKDSQFKIYYQILNGQIMDYQSFPQSVEQIDNQIKTRQKCSKFSFINKIRKLDTSQGKRNIYALMIQFLNQYSHKYSLEAMNFTAQVMDLLTSCINEHYMHFDSRRVLKDYCRQNNSQTVPQYFNFFLIWYLPSKELIVNENSQKVKLLLKIFFKWLKDHAYTTLDFFRQQKQQQQEYNKLFLRQKREQQQKQGNAYQPSDQIQFEQQELN